MIQSSTTPDQGYHVGKQQKYNKHHQQEPRGQLGFGMHPGTGIQRASYRVSDYNNTLCRGMLFYKDTHGGLCTVS